MKNLPAAETEQVSTADLETEQVSTADLIDDDVSVAEAMILIKQSKVKEAVKQQ